MSRTEELRNRGARDRTGGGGGAPFVKWGDGYAWVEGTVESVWQTQYGDAVEMMVTNASPGIQTDGKDEDGNRYQGTVRQSEPVNIGLNNKMLEGAITADDVGKVFHVAFEGWQDPNKPGANRYRVFTVLEIGDERAQPGENVPTSNEVQRGTGMEPDQYEGGGSPDDDLPF